MGGEDHPVRAGNGGAEKVQKFPELRGEGIAHGVGDVDRSRPGRNGDPHGPGQEVPVASGRVLGGKLHLPHKTHRVAHRAVDGLEDLLRGELELLLHMEGGGGQEGVDSGRAGLLERAGGGFDILGAAPGEGADGGVTDLFRDGADRRKVVGRGHGKAGFEDVDPHLLELPGDLELLLLLHGGPGALLAVAEGGVEDANPLLTLFFVAICHDALLKILSKMRAGDSRPGG